MKFSQMIPAALLLAAPLLSACATLPDAASSDTLDLRIAGLNDFHGNLEPIRRPLTVQFTNGESTTVATGGAAWLAATVDEIRSQSPYSMAISAGDLIGGSPLVSSLFLDEPAIGVMNRIGIDFNAVGNHEFDRGAEELSRIQYGGCQQFTLRTPCQVESPYEGADFTFLAANVVRANGRTLFPAYGTKTFEVGKDTVTVAVIGLTLTETPTLVTPSGVEGLDFRDEAQTINALVPLLQGQGIETIIVSIHQGLYQNLPVDAAGCEGISGPLLAIIDELDPAVDLVISGHTHQRYVCDYSEIDPERRLLATSAGYGGAFVTDITLQIDRATGDVKQASAVNRVVQSVGFGRDGNALAADARLDQVSPDAEVAAYVAQYVEAASDVAARPVGKISGPAPKPGPATEETQLGNLIADAQLAATRANGADIALMNNTGIRTALTPAEDGTVTFGDIYSVQPFGNTLITRTFTGAQLLALLEQQFDDEGFVQTFSPSANLAYSYDMSRPVGSRVVTAEFEGNPIEPTARYRITVNSFMAAGGDSFTVLKDGTDSTTGPLDLDAFEAYLRETAIRELPATGRVTEIK